MRLLRFLGVNFGLYTLNVALAHLGIHLIIQKFGPLSPSELFTFISPSHLSSLASHAEFIISYWYLAAWLLPIPAIILNQFYKPDRGLRTFVFGAINGIILLSIMLNLFLVIETSWALAM